MLALGNRGGRRMVLSSAAATRAAGCRPRESARPSLLWGARRRWQGESIGDRGGKPGEATYTLLELHFCNGCPRRPGDGRRGELRPGDGGRVRGLDSFLGVEVGSAEAIAGDDVRVEVSEPLYLRLGPGDGVSYRPVVVGGGNHF